MKLGEIINSKQALERFLGQNIPIELAWKIKTFVNKINAELKAYEEIREAKITELGEVITDENSPQKGQLRVKDENMKEFMDLINELLGKELELIAPSVSIAELVKYGEKTNNPISISTADIIMLDWLIKE